MTEQNDSLDAIIRVLKEPAELSPDLTQRVMAEIERMPAPEPVPERPLPWWSRPWTIRLTPLRALALAAGLAVLMFALPFRRRAAEVPTIALPSGQFAGGHLTQFVLVAPQAKAVTLVGDFNDWSTSATPLVRAAGDGVWYVTLPLPPGRYRYAFVVDGTFWRNDPESPSKEDEFGRPNSVVTVGGG